MKTISTVDEYIGRFPEEVQTILARIRKTIRTVVPDVEEVIRYGIPTFRLKENICHFAAYKKHIGFYPTPSVIEVFKDELRDYKTSKGAIQFPLDKPIPYGLVRRMVEYRAKQIRL